MTLSSKFLCRSKMIIPFSGKYHVPDSNDWGSSSCPSLVAPRSAKRRRTERTMHTRRTRMVRGKRSQALIQANPACKCQRKKYSTPSVGSLGHAAESPLVLCIRRRPMQLVISGKSVCERGGGGQD